MKIILINPPAMVAYGKYKAAAKAGEQPQMPMGICYIAAVLRKAGHKLRLIDSDVEGYSIPDLIKIIRKLKPDSVFITATTPIYQSAKKMIELVKKEDKNIIVILGGFHITALPVETMKNCGADYCVYGEGEKTVVELVDRLEKEKSIKMVKGILYKKHGKVIKNPPREPIKELESLPYPARDLLKYKKYLWSVPKKGIVPVTSIITQRGCPFQCIFCGVQTMFKGVRYRPLNKVIDEIEHIIKDLGINHILFQDDTLTLNKPKVIGMCKEIKKRGIEFTWEGYTRANTVTKELLKMMKDVGLVRLSFGVETGNAKILKAIKKGVDLESYKKAYQWCYELGIETRCSLMLGHPFETKETIKETMKFANSLKCYQAYINITTPYPGSELLNLAKQGYGGIRLLTTDWKEYRRYGNAVMEMNDLSKEDLIKMQKWAYRKFYLRPHIIWYNIKRAGLKAAIINGIAFVKSVFG